MRTSGWISGMALALLAVIGLFSFQFAAPAQPTKPDVKPIADDRDELANKLMERVTLNELFNNVPLKEVVKDLSERFNITLLVDQKSFPNDVAPAAAALLAEDDSFILNKMISVPVMKNVRLATAIKEVADQIGGVYLVFPDQIRIVNAWEATMITKPQRPDGESFVSLRHGRGDSRRNGRSENGPHRECPPGNHSGQGRCARSGPTSP